MLAWLFNSAQLHAYVTREGFVYVNGRHVGDRTPLGKETAAAMKTHLGSWGFPAL